MQSLSYAFHFIGACFSLAVKNHQLKRSWLLAGLGALVLLVIGFIPLTLVSGLLGLSPVGLILTGLIITLLIFLLLAWGQITALLTCHAFAEVIQDIDHTAPSSESPLNVLVNHGFDVFLFVFTLPGLFILKKFRQLSKRETGAQLDWLNAHYLVIPVISLDDRKLTQAIDRIKQIIADNLLRFRDDLVPVKKVAHIVQWVLMVCGGILGIIVAIRIADPVSATAWQRVLGTGVGLLVAGIPSILGIIFSNFSKACYSTTLYQWVRNVESARETGETEKAAPPEILRQILGMKNSKK